ncbi:MAG: glycine cleavage system aminomethyltransferase GcvT [Proteobacteria bacterium]|jgi:aminomethyltransferase|nr:glycine cleavage system aminomethyltransferase GcvT [Pseudomonadota bacterium]MDA1299900.1 glycine cleavage system aminomethyltransferase GcvT [Pseudomonadota bacterium]
MGHRTTLYPQHVQAGARFVDFAGWEMPVHYGSLVQEHHTVRGHAGAFDVSHMTVVDIRGLEAGRFLSRVLANDVRRVGPRKAIYSAMLNAEGGILDDLIVYPLNDEYRMVVNCATRNKDLAWLREQLAGDQCTIDARDDLSIVAVQGPQAISACLKAFPVAHHEVLENLKVFEGTPSGTWYIARTGYTGEQGVEVIVPNEEVVDLWQELNTMGVQPIGLGARDTLRLEAGLNLYGSDMDESVTPFESNMAWTVVLEDREFIGRQALTEQLARGVQRNLVGLVMDGKGVMRAGYPVFCDDRPVGSVTSGAFSPTLSKSIALARLSDTRGQMCVGIRGRKLNVEVVRPPFVKNGKQVFKPAISS